ncbi:MAG: hypothetical protein WC607_00640 [Candidatus Micrarchaeia archaeon]
MPALKSKHSRAPKKNATPKRSAKLKPSKPRVKESAAKIKTVKLRVIEPVAPPVEKRTYPLKHLYSFVSSVAGGKGIKVVKSLGEGATDERIEEQTGFKVSEVRHVLNQLHKHGIVEYNREKNMTTGWFTYTWQFNMDRTMKNFLSAKARRQRELVDSLASERGRQFYSCRKGCLRLGFEDAVDRSFKCTCGSKLAFEDNAKRIHELEDEMGALNALLSNAELKS